MSHPDTAGRDGTVHSDPLSAWKHLCAHGGIELKGRDEELQEELRVLIDARQLTLEDALAGATMESFVNAFFHLIHPFVSIFQDILAFFKQAEATEGQAQWVLKIDEIDMDLEHFRKWMEKLTSVGRLTLHVAAVDMRAVWRLWDLLRDREVIAQELNKSFQKMPLNLPDDVQEWVEAYSSGEYREIPASLSGSRCPPQLKRSELIAEAAVN
jgi:hypothetical protein